jgi:hypothetical protein
MRSNLATALFLAAGLSVCASAASAQQGDDRFAGGVDVKERRACTPDVQRLCDQYGSDVPQIVACLKRAQESHSLSPACSEVFSVPKECKADVQSLCKDYLVTIPSVSACLKRELDQGNLHAPCAQAVAAADAPAQKAAKKPSAKKPRKASAK